MATQEFIAKRETNLVEAASITIDLIEAYRAESTMMATSGACYPENRSMYDTVYVNAVVLRDLLNTLIKVVQAGDFAR